MKKERIKKNAKKILIYVIVFVIMLLLFCAGMIATYALPNQKIQAHIRESKDFILELNGNPLFAHEIKNGELDLFTDLLILNTAMNKGNEEDESVIRRAFENSRFSNQEGNQFTSLEQTINDNNIYNNQEYSRYWHGIQTIIRPLLLLFNYEEIRYILNIVILVMLATICIYKNLNIIHAIAFMFSMLAVCFFVVPNSLQYIGTFTISLLGIILVSILYKKKKTKLYPLLIFIIGGCTSFFDLLTVPIITLGMPLIFIMLLENKKEYNIKKMFFEMIKLSILWFVSYTMIWFAKWVIASIILQEDIISIAINTIFFRTNGNEEYPVTRLGAIGKNISYLMNHVLIACFILSAVIWIMAIFGILLLRDILLYMHGLLLEHKLLQYGEFYL